MKKKTNKKSLSLENKILIVSILFLFIIIVNIVIYVKRIEIGYPIKNILNNSDSLTEEHCLDNICINNMNIYYNKDNISSVSGLMKNTSPNTIDACVKIKFTVPEHEETIDYNFCYYELKTNEEVPIETYFNEDQKDLVFATNYELDYLSDEELQQLYDAREKDENN